jgi:glyoxylase-like metal-dependent hydrolase (beta-lactamase superfamily II)
MMAANIAQLTKDLYLLTLVPPIQGFESFICSWLYKGDRVFIVDVGPAVTADALIASLQALGVNRLDYILLTHIHLDHAGAIGEVAAAFPEAPIVCHPAGIPHLIDPTRLWQGTLKTLGRTGEIYGPVQAVAPQRLVDADAFREPDITPVMTPGHSQHHVAFNTAQYLFAGEAGGVFWSPKSEPVYLRPATPPRFFFDVYRQSVQALVDTGATALCYGHYGMTTDAQALLKRHCDQLELWREIIAAEIPYDEPADFLDRCTERLLAKDPLLAGYATMAPLIQERERGFMRNSIKGFAGYLEAMSK